MELLKYRCQINLLTCAFLAFCGNIFGQSYHGCLFTETEGKESKDSLNRTVHSYIAINEMPIWMDISISDTSGKTTGSYFYSKYGQEIKLSGTKNGDSLLLSEFDNMNKVSGVFKCKFNKNTINGIWQNAKHTKTFSVSLRIADSNKRVYAKVLNGKQLLLLDKTPLFDKFNEKQEGFQTDNNLSIYFADSNILSISYSWEYVGGPYPSYGTKYHVFDVQTKREINLWKEIDPTKMNDFNKYLCNKIQPKITENRKRFADSEWIDAFNITDNNNHGRLDSNFLATDLRHLPLDPEIERTAVFYIGSKRGIGELPVDDNLENGNLCSPIDSLHFVIDGYFSFPHVIMALDLFCTLSVSFGDLKKYIRKDSIFQYLIHNN